MQFMFKPHMGTLHRYIPICYTVFHVSRTHAHTLKPLSTQQGSGSAPVQQWFNLALNTMEHDSSFRQMSIYVTDDADSEAAIHCVISWGFEGLRFYMWKGTHNRYMQSSECAHTYGYLKKLFWAN